MRTGIEVKNIRFQGYKGNRLWGEIYFSSGRRGPAVLFCHGYKTDHREFSDFPVELAKRGFIAMVFDYSGNGLSEGSPNLFTDASHKIDTFAALKELQKEGAGPIYILGHSLGTHIAMYNLAYNKDIDAGVFVTPMRRGGENLFFLLRAAFYFIGYLYRLLGRILPDIYFKGYNLRYCAYSITINDAKLAADVLKPALFVIAKDDKTIRPKASMDVYEKISSKNKELFFLENSGHSVFCDNDRELLLSRIVQFLKQYS